VLNVPVPGGIRPVVRQDFPAAWILFHLPDRPAQASHFQAKFQAADS
jgi:hypothetical protein